MISRLCALLLLLSPVASAGQAPPRWRFAVDRFDVEDGLPGNSVTDLSLAEDGRLWVVASGILASFDGLTFERFGPDGLPDEYVESVHAASADTLWINMGGRIFAVAGDRLHLIAEHDREVYEVWQEPDGTVWGRDPMGFLRLGSGGLERVVELPLGWSRWLFLDEEGLPPRSPGDRLRYVDTRGGRVRMILGRWLADPVSFPANWPGARERSALLTVVDEGDSIRVSTAGSAVRIPAELGRRPILFDQRGLLWTRSPTHVEAFDEDGTRVVRIPLPGSLQNESVLEDSRGNLWMNAAEEGLVRIRPLPVDVLTGVHGLPGGQISRLYHGGDRSVLVHPRAGGLFRTDGVTLEPVRAVEGGVRIRSALTDRRGTTWVAADEGERSFLERSTADGGWDRIEIPWPRVVSISEDPDIDGLLWLAGDQLARVRIYEAETPRVDPPLLSVGSQVRDLLFARDGGVWIAHRDGVTRWAEDGVQSFLAEDGLPTGVARTLHEDDEGTLWIGRYPGGIVRYRGGRFDEVRAEDGLWEDAVNSILEDGEGNFWMSGNRGVHRVPRQALNDFIEGRIARVPGRGYVADQGFLNPESSGWPGLRTQDGRLWFPTFEGVAVLDPARILRRERHRPGIRLLEVRTQQGALPADSTVELPVGERRIEFSFAAVDLSDVGTHRYEVLLEGVDDEWVDLGPRRSTAYTSVPPGRRSFQVRAVSEAGIPSNEAAAVEVFVPPFFHETRWFAVLAALLGMSLLAGGSRLRSRRMRAHATELRRIVAARTAELTRSRAQAEEALVKLGQQAEELRTLGAAKSRFFANVSHELRTPLTLVNGPLQEVLDGRFGEPPEPVREQLALIRESGHRLGELVEQLLDVARLESGNFELRRAQVDLRPLLIRLGRSFTSLAASRDIRLTVSIPDGAVIADVDVDQIEKVVANLLSNAVKFTRAGGAIAMTVEEREGEARPELVIRVEDDGPGIAAEDREDVFERFQRRGDEGANGGTGLGLALVRELTELHGGRVELKSTPGRGSRFTVILPAAPDPGRGAEGTSSSAVEPPADEPSASRRPVAGDIEGASPLPGGTDGSNPGTPAEYENEEEAERPTVLIVEDHDGLRAYIRRQLDSRYRVLEARDGLEGLEVARRIIPDLILCDIMMPGMDGEEVCREIRSDPELSWLPVVMLTAKASQESRLSALQGGADGYLVKPFDPEELLLRVDNLVAGRKRHAEHLRADRGAWTGWVPPSPRGNPAFAEQLFALLRERASDEDFSTEAMARALAMSRSTLYRKVAEALDSSPAELLWTFRLEQAAEWLRETDARVSDVAYGCGFRTVPHFTRKFKERYGTTPAAWRSGEAPSREAGDTGP